MTLPGRSTTILVEPLERPEPASAPGQPAPPAAPAAPPEREPEPTRS